MGLSYKNTRELNALIDKLPSCPQFTRHEVILCDEVFEMYSRQILECIKLLFGDPDFLPCLLLKPEKHYTDASKANRMYYEMNTGRWWWATQVSVS